MDLMTRAEAESAWDQFCHHVESGRKILRDFYVREGWRALGYASWRDFAVAMYNQSQSYLYRQLEAAQIEAEISPIGEIGVIPEGQLRALGAVPRGRRKQVWDEALATAPDGKVTAKHVQSVVDRIAPKPARRKPQTRPKKLEDDTPAYEEQSQEGPDGEALAAGIDDDPDDPPDIAEQRRRGIIPEGVAVTIDEPAPSDEDEPANVMREQTDAEWLATLPARPGLHEVCLKIFDRDALLFRAVTPHRKKFRHHVKPLLNEYRRLGRTGTYHFYVSSFLTAKDPKDWLACFDCKGTGQFKLIGECPTCHGRGYFA